MMTDAEKIDRLREMIGCYEMLQHPHEVDTWTFAATKMRLDELREWYREAFKETANAK